MLRKIWAFPKGAGFPLQVLVPAGFPLQSLTHKPGMKPEIGKTLFDIFSDFLLPIIGIPSLSLHFFSWAKVITGSLRF